MESVSKRGCSEVCPFSAHRSARPPALIANIQDLHGPQMFVTIVASYCKDQGEGEEVDSVEACFSDECLRFCRVTRHGRGLRVSQEIQNGSKMLRVSIEEDPAIAVTTHLVSARKKALEIASRLLNQSRSCGLKNSTTNVEVNGGLCSQLWICQALSLCFKESILLTEFLVLMGHGPPVLSSFLLHSCTLLVDSLSGFLNVCLNLPQLHCSFFFGAETILPDFLHLPLLFGHKLLPHRQLLFLKSLAASADVTSVLL
mmetsp:Transcript_97168/g.173089  ORF Transcript_97168/g.173089 Transcript_97168/m.173089 type:complete len:257 (-) Transcript_97168:347-1117(-)